MERGCLEYLSRYFEYVNVWTLAPEDIDLFFFSVRLVGVEEPRFGRPKKEDPYAGRGKRYVL